MYVDSDGTIFDAALNQTNAGNNANKFYRIQVEPVDLDTRRADNGSA